MSYSKIRSTAVTGLIVLRWTPGAATSFFRDVVFNNHVNCVATNVDPNNVAPISSLQIASKRPGGMLVNSVGANGLISTDFDIVCSGS
jgi:hypothetical protein